MPRGLLSIYIGLIKNYFILLYAQKNKIDFYIMLACFYYGVFIKYYGVYQKKKFNVILFFNLLLLVILGKKELTLINFLIHFNLFVRWVGGWVRAEVWVGVGVFN